MASRTFRAFVAVAALSLAAAGCTAETGSEGPAPEAKGATAEGNVTLWHFFSGREAEAIQAVVDDFEKANPKITVDVRSEQDDEKVRQAIAAGKGPDLGISYSTAIVGSFCSTGAFIDLEPWMERDGVSADIFPDLVSDYTEFDGTRCAMPMLADAYGLYYNKKMLADAGFDGPPKTAEELTEMAKALTVRNPDGSIKVAGFVPTFGFYENTPEVMAPAWGAQWLDDDLDPQIADDPAWADLLEWQKELVDWYGLDNLNKFTAGIGQEWSADNAFQTGKIAMNLDGEWRNAFIAADAPDLDYGTAPFPGPEDRPELYGAGYVTGTIAGIPRGAENPEAAWALLKYLTTDTDALVKLSNSLRNVPTTEESLGSPDLVTDPNFQTFIDVFQNEHSATTPATRAGAEGYTGTMGDFTERWQQGQVDDLAAGLREVDDQMTTDLQRSAP
ncbi:ABC transporter substrate-binding protein [Nocardioides sp.]|uniref:ABC transporter substrate-binding protein n=1 Tax=Nocardioides sp. TaxID=35761 RepID=UPI00261B289D|nr:ABC transporter substrate-binding protein [Nocardioides sp.]MDI6909204.1 ABC transporter substrate-binding protein [Nocardioides sp.]